MWKNDAQSQQSIHPGNGFHGDPSPKSYHQTQGFTHQEQTEEGISAAQVWAGHQCLAIFLWFVCQAFTGAQLNNK